MEFTCNKIHYNKEFNLKGQYVGIVYSSEDVKVHYIIKTKCKLSNNIHIIIMVCGSK